MKVTILVVLVVIALVCFGVWWFHRKNTRRDAARRAALALAAECQAREDERRAARDAAKVIFSPLDVERAFSDDVTPLFPSKPVKKPAKAKKARHVPVKKRKAKKS